MENSKVLKGFIFFVIITGFAATFVSGSKGKDRVFRLSEMKSSDVDLIQVRHEGAKSFTTLRGINDEDIDSFLSALSEIDSATFLRPPSPNEKVLLRIKAKNETYDLDFRLHDSSDWIYFSLVERAYRSNSDSWTQNNYGKFRVKGVYNFLIAAADAS